ncbi:MAG: SGNH/GDSL hydrolase family protein [Candidatus Omnitrophota bacterium]|nr:SGNH/GDSL hydrolase family protein [Candidatus Omnitrophota bacterium]
MRSLASRHLISFALGLAVFCIVLETSSALALKFIPNLGAPYTYLANMEIDNPYIPYLRSAEPGVHHGTNTQGFRGQEVPLRKDTNEVRILCVGGSTAVDQATFAESWPGRLEAKLSAAYPDKKITVLVQAVGSWFSSDNLVFYALRAQDYNFDIVLIYDGWNDLTPSMSKNFRTDYSHSRGRPESALRFLNRLKRLHERFPLLLQTNTYRLLWGITYRIEMPRFNNGMFRDRGSPSHGIRGADTFERNIRTIATLAASQGSRVLYVSHVDLATPKYMESLDSWLQHRNHLENIRAAKEAVESLPGGLFFDLAAVFPQDEHYFTDRIHFTGEGSEIVSDLIADFIRSKDIVQQWNDHQPVRSVVFAFSDLSEAEDLGPFKIKDNKAVLAGVNAPDGVRPAVYMRPHDDPEQTVGIKVPLGELPAADYTLDFGIGYSSSGVQPNWENVGTFFNVALSSEHETVAQIGKRLVPGMAYRQGDIVEIEKDFQWDGGPAYLSLTIRSEVKNSNQSIFFTYPIIHLSASGRKM